MAESAWANLEHIESDEGDSLNDEHTCAPTAAVKDVAARDRTVREPQIGEKGSAKAPVPPTAQGTGSDSVWALAEEVEENENDKTQAGL